MKNILKLFGVFALMAVIGFSMAACGGGDGNGDDDDSGFTSDLSGKTVQLTKNEYSSTKAESKGLQGFFQDPAMMQGKKVNTGDKFKLNITFKVDKTLDEDMWIFMIDNSPAVDYWKGLTSSYAIPKGELVANTEIKKEFTLTATETATSNNAVANTLVFDCNDSWSKSPVTITFVSFTFTKLAADEDEYTEYTTGILTITNFSGKLNQNDFISGYIFFDDVANDEIAHQLRFGVSPYQELQIKGDTLNLKVFDIVAKKIKADEDGRFYLEPISIAPFTEDKTVETDNLGLGYTHNNGFDLYYNMVPITFINGNASIDFNTQMQKF